METFLENGEKTEYRGFRVRFAARPGEPNRVIYDGDISPVSDEAKVAMGPVSSEHQSSTAYSVDEARQRFLDHAHRFVDGMLRPKKA